MSDNVHPYRREPLEPEIAAVSIETSPEETPLTVVNVDVQRTLTLAALRKLRPHVLIPILLSGAIGWTIRTMRERPVATAIVGTAAASTLVVGGGALILDSTQRQHPLRPPTAIRVVTLPPSPAVTRTVTASATPTRWPLSPPIVKRWTREPVRQEAVFMTEPTQSTPSSSAKASRRPSPTPTKSERRPRETASAIPSASAVPSAQAPPTPSPNAPDPISEQEAAPEATNAQKCTIDINLDPLLSLCVLG